MQFTKCDKICLETSKSGSNWSLPADLVLQRWAALASSAYLLLYLLFGLIDAPRDSHSWKGGSKPEEGTKTSGPHGVQQLSCFLVVN